MSDTLKSLLSEIDTHCLDFWNIPFLFLGVKRCNADEYATFSTDVSLKLEIISEYVHWKCSYIGTSLCRLYIESVFAVLLAAGGKSSEITDLRQRKAVETLIKFMKNLEEGGNHHKCLKRLQSEDFSDNAETQIQAVLASHLFSPLLTEGEGEVIVDNSSYYGYRGNSETSESESDLKPECPFCKHSLKTENTNFGVKDLWHGRAGIVVKTKNSREVVQVTVDKVEDENEDGGGGDESVPEKTELAYSDCLAKEKTIFDGTLTTFIDNKTYKQAISQTLLNAFLAVKYNKRLVNALIPSFLVCQNSVFINFYNVNQDVLLVQSLPMHFFRDDVNYASFFSVWMALNFEVFASEMPTTFYSTTEKSGFTSFLQVNGVLERYKNEIDANLSLINENNYTGEQFRNLAVCQKETDALVAKYTSMMKSGKLFT